MKNIISAVLCLALLIAATVCCFAANYYVNVNCSNNGDGSTPSCAGSPGGAGYYNVITNLLSDSGNNNWYVATDQVVYTGSTDITLRLTGTSAQHAQIDKYGSGALPIFDGSSSLSGWASLDANIYYKPSAVAYRSYVLTEDGNRLAERHWNTNWSTTKAGTTSNCTAGQPPSTANDDCKTDAMVAGTWTQSTVDYGIYVWASSLTPASHTYRYATTAYGLRTQSSSSGKYFDIRNISGRIFTTNFINVGWDGNIHTDVNIYNVSSTMTGARGVSLSSANGSLTYSTCSDATSEDYSDNNACLVISGIASYPAKDNVIAYNSVSKMRNGSCYEINGSWNGVGHDNIGIGCSQLGFEAWGSKTGTISGYNNKWYNNYLSTSGAISLDPNARCLSFDQYEYYGTSWNNVCVGNWDVGYYVGTSATNNKFYNETLYSTKAGTSSANGGFTYLASLGTAYNNSLKNTVMYFTQGARCINTTATDDNTVFDKNICIETGNTPYKFRNSSYANLAAYQSAYTSATGLTDNSIYQDPQIDWSLYAPQAGSPALGFGVITSLVTTDKNGKVRSAVNDAGAVQTSNDTSIGKMQGVTRK